MRAFLISRGMSVFELADKTFYSIGSVSNVTHSGIKADLYCDWPSKTMIKAWAPVLGTDEKTLDDKSLDWTFQIVAPEDEPAAKPICFLRAWKIAQGITTKELAQKMGVNVATIFRFFREHRISKSTRAKMLKTLSGEDPERLVALRPVRESR